MEKNKIILQKTIEIDLIKIPSGDFLMGSPDGAKDKQHNVHVNAFEIGRYPITQEQWMAIASRNDLKVNIDLDPDPSKHKNPQNPVTNVNWYEAVEFCDRLSKLTGENYRLPSESEWEYACRAGTQTHYYFGDDASQLEDYAWHESNSGNQPHPVGQKKPNAFGLYDMHGNVWEWTNSNYKPYSEL